MMRRFICLTIIYAVIFAGAACADEGFGGIGIDGVPWADGRIVVRQLVEGGPAHIAGIRVGDIITHIDGKATEGSDFREMVERRLRGRAGTPVAVRVRRPGQKKPLDFKLTRRKLVPPGRKK